MPKRVRSPEQIEADKARMAAVRAKRQTDKIEPETISEDTLGPQLAVITDEPQAVVGAGPEVVGANLNVDNSDIKSMLEEINEDSEVDIYNPLDQGFRVQFTITTAQPVSLSAAEQDVHDKAGLPHNKDMGQSMYNAVKFTVLPAHKVTRLPGKVAHVAVKQLRNYIMRADRSRYKDVADPAALREAEEKIVLKISNSMDNVQNPSSELDRKIAEMNVGV